MGCIEQGGVVRASVDWLEAGRYCPEIAAKKYGYDETIQSSGLAQFLSTIAWNWPHHSHHRRCLSAVRMTNKTSASSNSLPGQRVWSNRLTVAAPPGWHWLISALSGTVETEKQTARLKQSNAELKKSNEELKKSNEELKQENLRLAELESKIDGLFYKYGISSTRANEPEQR